MAQLYKIMKPLVIFGYAAVGRRVYERKKLNNPGRIIAFCDNSSVKHGEYDGVRVLSLQEAVRDSTFPPRK